MGIIVCPNQIVPMMSESVTSPGLSQDLKIQTNNNDVLKTYLLEHSSVFSKLCDLRAKAR